MAIGPGTSLEVPSPDHKEASMAPDHTCSAKNAAVIWPWVPSNRSATPLSSPACWEPGFQAWVQRRARRSLTAFLRPPEVPRHAGFPRGAPATSLPGVQPCSRRVPHRVHWKGAPPQPARSARRLHRALARQRCSQRSVSKKPADARHPFPLLRLSFPYFWARNLLPEPLPPPPHPSWLKILKRQARSKFHFF